MNLSVSVLLLVAYALAQRTHTYSFSSSLPLLPLPFLPPPHTQMRFACMLDWITHAGSGNLDPCGLPSLFGPEYRQALFSIYNFKQISQLNWLRNRQNQRLNSAFFFGVRVGDKVWEFLSSCLPEFASKSIPHWIWHPSAVRFITGGGKSVQKGLILWLIRMMRSLIPDLKMLCLRGWR